MSTAEVTRWAMVGTGSMARNIVADFRATENVELITVVSRSVDKGREFAAAHGIPNATADLDSVLTDPDIDVVYIATPHPAHFAAAKAAILGGKHVLVEKPMTVTSGEARELAALAQDAGVFLMEAMWTRFNPAVRRMLQRIGEGAIGTVRHVQASFGFAVPPDPENRLWKPELGGGSTLDQGVYTVTLPYLVFGKPTSIWARGTVTETGVDSETTVMLGFPDGQQATLATSMTTFLPSTAAVGGSAGVFELGRGFWAAHSLSLFGANFSTETTDFPKEANGYVPMLRAVSAAVLDGRTEHELCPVSETIDVLEILEEIMGQIAAQA